jgi:hypothetical protein
MAAPAARRKACMQVLARGKDGWSNHFANLIGYVSFESSEARNSRIILIRKSFTASAAEGHQNGTLVRFHCFPEFYELTLAVSGSVVFAHLCDTIIVQTKRFLRALHTPFKNKVTLNKPSCWHDPIPSSFHRSGITYILMHLVNNLHTNYRIT